MKCEFCNKPVTSETGYAYANPEYVYHPECLKKAIGSLTKRTIVAKQLRMKYD
jgi:hypothetical protein